jgi:hypothetical protein
LGLVWYDDLADWFSYHAEDAKSIVSESEWVLAATVVNSSIDLAGIVLDSPKQIGHLGEATGETGEIGNEPLFQAIRDLGKTPGTFSVNPTLENSAGVFQDVSVAVSLISLPKCSAKGRLDSKVDGIKLQSAEPTASVHKNSLAYIGETHVYRIKGPDGSTYKIGESAQGVRAGDGLSLRAEQQVRELNKKTGQTYSSEIRKKFKSKAEARAYEKEIIRRFRRMHGDQALPGNKNNR